MPEDQEVCWVICYCDVLETYILDAKSEYHSFHNLYRGKFMTAVSWAKVTKYMTSTLEELLFSNKGPTTLYYENMSAIMMDKSKNTK